jgi:hypothetical protein
MCMIQGEVEHVSATKILAAPIKTFLNVFPQQFTVYSNNVSMESQSGAMILPFPGQFRQFVDLTQYKHLFTDLKNLCWPQVLSKSNSSYSRSASKSLEYLPVHNVGSYQASVVPGLDDLPRINPSVFQIDPRIFEFLKQNYSQGFGFMVCMLKNKAEYHPFGYIHDRLPSGQMFIPTMHYHLHGSSHKSQSSNFGDVYETKVQPFGSSGGMKFASIDDLFDGSSHNSSHNNTHDSLHNSSHGSDQSPHFSVDWDHEIYIWNKPLGYNIPEFQSTVCSYSQAPSQLKMQYLPTNIEPYQSIYAYKIRNYNQNHDLIAAA